MGTRRHIRELAVQALFQLEFNPQGLPEAFVSFWDGEEAREDIRPAVEQLVAEVRKHQDQVDRTLVRHMDNWRMNRLAAVDRNILRLAVFEMLYRPDIPPVVSINEAVDIAKKFSTSDSGSFVNGILDHIKNELPRPARTPAPAGLAPPEDPSSGHP